MIAYVVTSSDKWGDCNTVEGVFSTPERVRKFFEGLRDQPQTVSSVISSEPVPRGATINGWEYWVDMVELDTPGIVYNDED